MVTATPHVHAYEVLRSMPTSACACRFALVAPTSIPLKSWCPAERMWHSQKARSTALACIFHKPAPGGGTNRGEGGGGGRLIQVR